MLVVVAGAVGFGLGFAVVVDGRPVGAAAGEVTAVCDTGWPVGLITGAVTDRDFRFAAAGFRVGPGFEAGLPVTVPAPAEPVATAVDGGL